MVTDAPSAPEQASRGHRSTAIPHLAVADALREAELGVLTGLTWSEAKIRHPELCQALMTAAEWVPIPYAETPDAGYRRAATFIQTLLTHHSNQDAIWIMAHQWIMEHLMASLMGCDRTWKMPIPNTAIFEFWLDCDRWQHSDMPRRVSDFWQIKHFGACPHLI
jgi:2,3-bisphosphoglycerate-dependent phosphoglycerate mutase